MINSGRRFGRTLAGQQQISAARDNAIAETVEHLADRAGVAGQGRPLEVDTAEFYITDVSGTELVAVAGPDAPTNGELEFDIRLPPELIEDARGGIDYTYTDVNNRNADDGVDSEDQEMNPPYGAGDVIVARMDDGDGVFVDTNRAGRAWGVPDS